MHVIASREMKRNGIPIEKYIAVNWMNEVDIGNIGADAAKGIKRGTNVAGGSNQPLIQEIIKELYDKGKGNGDRKNIEDVYYNTGLAIWSIAVEGVRLAIKKDGWPLTPEKIKNGLESMKDYEVNGLMAPVTVTKQDHGGGGKTRIEMWDGSKWVPQTDWIAAFKDDVWSVVKAQSAELCQVRGAEIDRLRPDSFGRSPERCSQRRIQFERPKRVPMKPRTGGAGVHRSLRRRDLYKQRTVH